MSDLSEERGARVTIIKKGVDPTPDKITLVGFTVYVPAAIYEQSESPDALLRLALDSAPPGWKEVGPDGIGSLYVDIVGLPEELGEGEEWNFDEDAEQENADNLMLDRETQRKRDGGDDEG